MYVLREYLLPLTAVPAAADDNDESRLARSRGMVIILVVGFSVCIDLSMRGRRVSWLAEEERLAVVGCVMLWTSPPEQTDVTSRANNFSKNCNETLPSTVYTTLCPCTEYSVDSPTHARLTVFSNTAVRVHCEFHLHYSKQYYNR